MSADLRLGDYREVMADVTCDAVIVDGPYSKRTHDGHADGIPTERPVLGGNPSRVVYERNKRLAGEEKRMRVDKRNGSVYSVGVSRRRAINYAHWTPKNIRAFVDFWAPRNRGWFVCMSDHALCSAYEAAYKRHDLTTFAPVGILIPGMTVRMAGDGPSSWMLYANVARPKSLSKWGTLPGGYTGPPGERVHIGGKAMWLMRSLVRDYSRKGDLVVDPTMGACSTGIAAGIEGRRFIGSEIDPDTFAVAKERMARGYTPTFEAFQ